jgi:predicted transcriptional regulator
METDEIVKLKKIGMLSERLLNTLKPAEDKRGMYIAEIRVYNYYELASIIKNLMKLCITAVHYDSVEVPPTIANQHIDVGLILGIALQLFPIDELELINEISDLYNNQYDETKAES